MIRTRFAPSPTGTPDSIHLGFIIRALWNYAYAKKNSGQFILRIEDTDTKRSRLDTEAEILKTLASFGISWDEGPDIGGPYSPYRQSERLPLYKQAALDLVDRGFAYFDFDAVVREKEEIKSAYESEEKLAELKIRPLARDVDPVIAKARMLAGDAYVVRIKIPEDKVFEYEDWILKKKIKILGKFVPDLILLKSDGFPTYHLAVVVDDIAMHISHIFRGQEWITSTPIHLYLYEAMSHPVPNLGHFTVILDPRTGKKFSKRDLTAMFGVEHWLQDGYLPEAILNYLMLLGWAPKDNRELFTLAEFVEAFDQDGVQKANPTFNVEKLNWFNGQYIRQKSDTELTHLVKPFMKRDISEQQITQILPLVKDRLVKLSDIYSLTDFLFTPPLLDISLFPNSVASLSHLQFALNHVETLYDSIVPLVKEQGWKVGDFFMSLRISICGSKFTPPLGDVVTFLGIKEVTQRLSNSVTLLSTSS